MSHEPGHSEHHEHRDLLPEDAPTWQIDVAEGCEVVTSDGDKIGTVKEVLGGYFKVNVHHLLHPEFWLQRQFVTSNDDGIIRMSFSKQDLDSYKVKFLPEGVVAQGQDIQARAQHGGDDIGFATEYVGGAVRNPESETMRAVEQQYNRDHRP